MKRLDGDPATRDHVNVAVQYVPNTGSVSVETVVQKRVGTCYDIYIEDRKKRPSFCTAAAFTKVNIQKRVY